MNNSEILRIAIKNIRQNRDSVSTLLGEKSGVDSAFGAIKNMLKSINIRNSNEAEIKKIDEYINGCDGKKIFNIKPEIVRRVWQIVYNNNTKMFNIKELYSFCCYTNQIIKSYDNLDDIEYESNREEQVKKIIKERELLERVKEEEEKKKKEEEKEEEEKSKMTDEEKFRYELNKAQDKDKFATDIFKDLDSMDEKEKKLKAAVLLEFYESKKETKKTKEKKQKLKQILA